MKKYKWLGLAAMLPSQGLIFMDQTILPVALPTIQRDFGVGNVALQWAVNSYLLLITMFALSGGKISDRIGHRFSLLIGLVIFTIASILSSLSPNIDMLIAARGLQGVGAALVIPSQTSLFAAIFPPGERGRAVGGYASFGSLFMILGPLVGGYLTETFTWHWIFWINVPIACIGFIMTLYFVPKTAPTQSQIDLRGLISFAAFAAGTVIFFMQGSTWGWEGHESLICVVVAFLSLCYLIRREIVAEHPFLDLSLFKHPLFSSINLSIGIVSFMLMISVFRAIYFQTVLDYTPAQAGMITFVSSIPVLFFSSIGGFLSDRFSPKFPIAIGYLLIIFSFFWLASFSTPSLASLLTALFAFGMGVPLIFTPSYSSAIGAVPPHKLGVGFGTLTTVRSFGSTMGVAIIGLMFDSFQTHHLSSIDNHSAQIASFSEVHLILGIVAIIAFACVFFLHNRKSAHHPPDAPAEGWD